MEILLIFPKSKFQISINFSIIHKALLKGEPCGRGAYFANDIDICVRGFLKFKVDGKACVLQVNSLNILD